MSNTSRNQWIVSAGLAAIAGWSLWSEWIAPLREQEHSNQVRISEVNETLKSARQALMSTQAKARRALEAQERLEYWSLDRSVADSMVRFPTDLKRHFRNSGISGPATHLITSKEAPGLPGFKRIYWRVTFSIGEKTTDPAAQIFSAATKLEASDASIDVLDYAVLPDPSDPARRIVALNIATLARE